MTAFTLAPAVPVSRSPRPRSLSRFVDVVVLTGRNLVHIAREPLQLSDVTVQPVLFTLLFVYVFGSGVVLPDGGSYKQYAIAGLMALNLTTSAMGTAVGLSTDLTGGVIDRFRTLPMWRPAVLVGRSVADVATAAVCAAIVALTGLAIGWRPEGSVGGVVGGFALFLLFSYALSWGCACLGIVSKGPESAQSVGLVILFPLAIVSNALVPTQHMPLVLRAIADWNPVSAVTAGARHLFGNPNPSASIHAWPLQHPVVASLGWSALLLAVFVPLATFLYRRRTRTVADTTAKILHKTAVITAVGDHGPHLRTIELQGDALKNATWMPGHKIQVRTQPAGLTMRTYTPTAWDSSAGTARLFVYHHGSGPGSTWTAGVSPGDRCQIFGPRPALRLDGVAESILFVGDETSFASVAAWCATHPGGQPVAQLFEVNDPDESAGALRALGLPDAQYVARRMGSSHLDELSSAVIDALRTDPDAALCLTGKAQTIARLRHSVKAAGFAKRPTRVKAYWDENRKGLD
jgi:ABC-2 type transport system permease protein